MPFLSGAHHPRGRHVMNVNNTDHIIDFFNSVFHSWGNRSAPDGYPQCGDNTVGNYTGVIRRAAAPISGTGWR